MYRQTGKHLNIIGLIAHISKFQHNSAQLGTIRHNSAEISAQFGTIRHN